MPTLDRLKDTPRDLVALISGVPALRLAAAPARGEWSAATVVSHLADAELVYGVRLRLVLTEETPFLAGYDEQAWAERFGSFDVDARQSLARFRMLRELTVRILASLDEEDWQRAGAHAELGEITVEMLAARLADHDRNRLDQIRRTLAITG